MALFGITKIDYCKANALAFSGAYNQFYGVASEPTNTFTNICDVVKNRATLSIEQQVVSKEVLYTSRLVFVTDTDPMLASDYYAFVVTTNAGERILIGAQNRPRTIVTTAQNVAATAGDLTAYTTTVEWQTNYRPLRLPVTVTPVTDTRQFDICCGQIARPVAPDLREFEICCGEIIGEVPPTLLTVRWLNGDGSLLDSKTYYSNQPEPTTTAIPTKAPTSEYTYIFDHWQVQSVIGTVKTYEPIFTAVSIVLTVRWLNGDGSVLDSKTYAPGQPEPTTTKKATKAFDGEKCYTFDHWIEVSDVDNVKTYGPVFLYFPAHNEAYIELVYAVDGTDVMDTNNNVKNVRQWNNSSSGSYLQLDFSGSGFVYVGNNTYRIGSASWWNVSGEQFVTLCGFKAHGRYSIVSIIYPATLGGNYIPEENSENQIAALHRPGTMSTAQYLLDVYGEIL